VDLSSGRVGRDREALNLPDAKLTSSEGSQTGDGVTRPGIVAGLRLEQGKGSLSTVGRPP